MVHDRRPTRARAAPPAHPEAGTTWSSIRRPGPNPGPVRCPARSAGRSSAGGRRSVRNVPSTSRWLPRLSASETEATTTPSPRDDASDSDVPTPTQSSRRSPPTLVNGTTAVLTGAVSAGDWALGVVPKLTTSAVSKGPRIRRAVERAKTGKYSKRPGDIRRGRRQRRADPRAESKGREIGSSGWTRTSNPPVNSRMLCQLSY